MQILSLVLLFVADFLNALLNDLLGFEENREVILNVHEDDECVANLNVVLGAEAEYDCLCDLEVPLVTNVTEVLKPDVIVGIRAL